MRCRQTGRGECSKAGTCAATRLDRRPARYPARTSGRSSRSHGGPYASPAVIDQTPSPASTNRRALGCLLEIVQTVVLTPILFLEIQSFVAQPFQVQQFSMQNTIQDRQFVLVDRLTPRFDGYHRGDIIVFTPPANAESPDEKPFIKRVIGIAGDTIEIRDGSVFVDGVKL